MSEEEESKACVENKHEHFAKSSSKSLGGLHLTKALHPGWLRTTMSKKDALRLSQHHGAYRTLRSLPTRVSERKVKGFDFKDLKDVSKQPIGEGCQARVFSVNRKKQALKILRPELAGDAEERKSFEREVHLMARLSHENICGFIGVGTSPDGLPCALLSFVDGVVAGASLSSRERFKIVTELSDALCYLHEEAVPGCSVLHRDLKPDNFGLTSQTKSLKLLDFGLAVCLVKASTREAYTLTGDTGSLRYMAPEVGRCESYGTPADVYSWAIASWEILADKGKPFAHFDVSKHALLVLNGNSRPTIPKSWHPHIPIKQAWDPDPSVRPTMRQIHTALVSLNQDQKQDPLRSSSVALCC